MDEGIFTKVIAAFTILGVIIAYLALAADKNFFPFNEAASGSAVPSGYQGDWNGKVSFAGGAVKFSLALSAGAPGARVGTVDVASECEAGLYLDHGGDRIGLDVQVAPGSGGACDLLSDAGIDLSAYISLSLTDDDSLEVVVAASPGGLQLGSGSLDRSS